MAKRSFVNCSGAYFVNDKFRRFFFDNLTTANIYNADLC